MATRVTISIPNDDKELLDWIDDKVDNKRFRNRSEGFRDAVREMKKEEEQDYNV